jgi:hypothetical protein
VEELIGGIPLADGVLPESKKAFQHSVLRHQGLTSKPSFDNRKSMQEMSLKRQNGVREDDDFNQSPTWTRSSSSREAQSDLFNVC